MTTLDSLLVRIDASTELLRRELAKGGTAVQNFSNTTERQLGGISGSFAKVGTALRSTLAAFGVGLGATAVVNFARNAIQAADAIGETARAAGIGAERFQRLSFVFRQNGVSAQEFEAAMRTANTRLGQFITSGAGPAAKAIEELGLKQRILNGEIHTNEQFVDAIITALGNFESSAQRAALASAFFGREAGAKLQDTLGRGKEAIDAVAAAATGVFSDETVAKADKLADAMERLGSATWNWAKGLAIAATYRAGQSLGVRELNGPEEEMAALLDRQRTLRAFGGQDLSDAESARLVELRRQITRARAVAKMNEINAAAGARAGMRADGRPSFDTSGLSEITTSPQGIYAELPRFDFASAAAEAYNSELQEIHVVLTKMPDDIKQLSPEFKAAYDALMAYNEGLTEAQQQQKQLVNTIEHGLQSAIANALRTGRLEFKQFLADLAIELASSALTKGLMSIFSGGATGSFAAFFGSLFGGKRALGGPMQAGKGYLVNEGKPELFWPGMSGSMVPVGAGGGNVTIVNNLTVHAGPTANADEVATESRRALADSSRRSVATVKELMRRRRL